MTTEWPFAERYKEYMMPPTQVRETMKRLQKKGADIAADNEENLNVIKAVHQAYSNKKGRARAASAASRASKKDVAYHGDIEDAAVTAAVPAATNVSVCDAAVDCVAEAVPEPAAPEVVAAPTPAVAAKKKSVARADNVASESAPVAAVPTVASTQAPKRLAETTPRRGLNHSRLSLCGHDCWNSCDRC